MLDAELSEQQRETAAKYAVAARALGASYCVRAEPRPDDDGGEDAVGYAMRDGAVVARESERLRSVASPTLG